MEKGTPVGAGSLLPSATNVNEKSQESSGAAKLPRILLPPMPPEERERLRKKRGSRPPAASPPSAPLGPEATAAMEALCRRYQVKPEHVTRALVESHLSETLADPEEAAAIAEDARKLEQTKAVPPWWWTPSAPSETPASPSPLPRNGSGAPAAIERACLDALQDCAPYGMSPLSLAQYFDYLSSQEIGEALLRLELRGEAVIVRRAATARLSTWALPPAPEVLLTTPFHLSVAKWKTLAKCCVRHRLQPVDFIRAILEAAFRDASDDSSLAPVWASEARAFAKRSRS